MLEPTVEESTLEEDTTGLVVKLRTVTAGWRRRRWLWRRNKS